MTEKDFAISLYYDMEHYFKYQDYAGTILKLETDETLKTLNLDVLKDECAKLGINMVLCKDLKDKNSQHEWEHGKGVLFQRPLTTAR